MEPAVNGEMIDKQEPMSREDQSMPGTGPATRKANQSYREVLRSNPRVAGLVLGDLLANVGTGMILVAMPVQTLSIHDSVPAAIAIGMVEAAPFVLSTILALAIGLGRMRACGVPSGLVPSSVPRW